MSLQNLLAAIVAHADHEIDAARRDSSERLQRLRAEQETALARRRDVLARQKEERKAHMRAKATTQSAIHYRNAVLVKKRALMDDVFADVLKALAALPEEKVEAFLRRCLKSIPVKGTIRPAQKHATLLKRLADSGAFTMGKPVDAAGGFMLVNDAQERNYTFEYFVQHVLRAQKELEIAATLFIDSPAST